MDDRIACLPHGLLRAYQLYHQLSATETCSWTSACSMDESVVDQRGTEQEGTFVFIRRA